VPGGDHSRKPPLYHWLTALGARRGLDETTLRLTAAVAAAGTAALTYTIGAHLATRAVGVVAASVLVASPTFFGWARIGRMDTLLVFCITLSVWGLGRWLLLGGIANGLLFGIGVGLGVLTKGPAGLLPLPIAAFALVTCRVQRGRLREFGPGLALAAVVPLAWLIPASVAAPDFTRYAQGVVPTLAGELAREATSSLNIAAGLVTGFFPWTLLVPGCLVLLARRRPMSSPLVVVSLGWLIVVFTVFGLVVPSRSVHFLPAYPALALLVAWGWHTAEGGQRKWLTVPLGLGVVTVVAAGIVLALRPAAVRVDNVPWELPPWTTVGVSGVVLLMGIAAFWLERNRRATAAFTTLAVGAAATLLLADVELRTPFFNALYPVRATVTRLEARISPGAEVGYTDSNRVTALAVYLSRPLRQLRPPAGDDALPPPAPPYVLLTDTQFETSRRGWSLHLVDEVVLDKIHYVLASPGPASGGSPR
jgi:4-amino-4-deoxy-L-arabinose transferase-like glycosyltransferase